MVGASLLAMQAPRFFGLARLEIGNTLAVQSFSSPVKREPLC
jgi:hypothetical protein